MGSRIKKFLNSYFPGALSTIILVVLAFFVPWSDVAEKLSDINPWTFAILILLGISFYLGKALRFWRILQLLGINKPFWAIAKLYLAGQPFAIFPAGEMYRAALLRRTYDIPLHISSPSITIQYIYEGMAVVSIATVAALATHVSRAPVLIVALGLALLIYGFKTEQLNGFIQWIPFVHPNQRRLTKFIRDNEKLLGGKAFIQLLALSYIPELFGLATIYIAAQAVGVSLSLVSTCLVYCLPMMLSAIVLLPGGFGASEGSTFALLRLFDASSAAAATTTLLYRVFNLGIGMTMGFIASFFVPRPSTD